MMAKYKGYHKKATSDKMMRIVKRERILSFILGGATLEKVPVEEAEQLLQQFASNPQAYEWKTKNLVRFEICEHAENKDYFDWKIKLIKETGWLRNMRTWQEGDFYYASWHDTRKLRIYRKWLYKANKRVLERVLKYMYSELFAAVLFMDRGGLTKEQEIVIDTGFNYGDNAEQLKIWFKDILNLNAEVRITPDGHYLKFDYSQSRKLLELIEPIIKEIPSMHRKLCEARGILKTG